MALGPQAAGPHAGGTPPIAGAPGASPANRRPAVARERALQLDAYLDRVGLGAGVLVLFDRRSDAPPIEDRVREEAAVTATGKGERVLRVSSGVGAQGPRNEGRPLAGSQCRGAEGQSERGAEDAEDAEDAKGEGEGGPRGAGGRQSGAPSVDALARRTAHPRSSLGARGVLGAPLAYVSVRFTAFGPSGRRANRRPRAHAGREISGRGVAATVGARLAAAPSPDQVAASALGSSRFPTQPRRRKMPIGPSIVDALMTAHRIHACLGPSAGQ